MELCSIALILPYVSVMELCSTAFIVPHSPLLGQGIFSYFCLSPVSLLTCTQNPLFQSPFSSPFVGKESSVRVLKTNHGFILNQRGNESLTFCRRILKTPQNLRQKKRFLFGKRRIYKNHFHFNSASYPLSRAGREKFLRRNRTKENVIF